MSGFFFWFGVLARFFLCHHFFFLWQKSISRCRLIFFLSWILTAGSFVYPADCSCPVAAQQPLLSVQRKFSVPAQSFAGFFALKFIFLFFSFSLTRLWTICHKIWPWKNVPGCHCWYLWTDHVMLGSQCRVWFCVFSIFTCRLWLTNATYYTHVWCKIKHFLFKVIAWTLCVLCLNSV